MHHFLFIYNLCSRWNGFHRSFARHEQIVVAGIRLGDDLASSESGSHARTSQGWKIFVVFEIRRRVVKTVGEVRRASRSRGCRPENALHRE